jgi:hypothetical protein
VALRVVECKLERMLVVVAVVEECNVVACHVVANGFLPEHMVLFTDVY